MSADTARRSTGPYTALCFWTGVISLGLEALGVVGTLYLPPVALPALLGPIGGGIAIAYGVVGCAKEAANSRCVIGLTTGTLAFLAPVALLFAVASP
ncbi:hypothetical protein [Streptomyces sp. NPDC050145]|uniref:hypothetical protein n=1 Tax=Streptomyces sp. NPDC050145 TaxID=3365602 RepID=UPI00379ADFED